jgi:hypothetical protein
MKILKFDEYLSSKGLVSKPKISLNGDNLDPKKSPISPSGGGKPYMSSSKKKKTISSLGDEGDKDLIYEPETDIEKKIKKATNNKLVTVQEMALATNLINSAKKNLKIIETVVRQLKSEGLLGALVAETLNHRETFNHISKIMAHESYGPVLCNKLMKAINEEVSAPFSDQLSGEEDEDEYMGDEDDMDMDDENDDMDMGDENDDMDMGDDEDMDMDDNEDMDMDDDEDMDMGDDDDMDMGDDDDMDMGDDDMDMGDDDMRGGRGRMGRRDMDMGDDDMRGGRGRMGRRDMDMGDDDMRGGRGRMGRKKKMRGRNMNMGSGREGDTKSMMKSLMRKMMNRY